MLFYGAENDIISTKIEQGLRAFKIGTYLEIKLIRRTTCLSLRWDFHIINDYPVCSVKPNLRRYLEANSR